MPQGRMFGVDLGTEEVRIYSAKKMNITSERNMIAVKNDRVIAVGDNAYEMFEKNPPGIDVRSSVKSGLISDPDRAGFILMKLFTKAELHPGLSPVVIFSVPLDMSRIERRAYAEVGERAGFKSGNIYLLDQPFADAIALDIPVRKTRGTMTVNIGAGHTVISVVSAGQIVIGRTLRQCGNSIDEAVCDAVRKKTNVRIGIKTANRLVRALADMNDIDDARKMYGIDSLTGVPGEVIVNANLVNTAAKNELLGIAEELKMMLERMPPQILGAIREEGIYITGGCSRIKNIQAFFEDAVGESIIVPDLYENVTATGLSKMITLKSLHDLASRVKDR